MSFASSIFWLFAVLVFLGYFWMPVRHRWILMLFASYGFYAYWDWRYTPLLLGSTLVDYYCVHRMARRNNKRSRKPWLWLSLGVNLGILFVFKYWNFVGTNLNALLGAHIDTHQLLLPLGISFYTFQSLSYTLDSYAGRIKPERHLGFFCLYVSFFPQLVAGPIERSQSLLPQVKSLGRPSREQFRRGCLLIMWGLFLKLCIADNLTSPIHQVMFGERQAAAWMYWFASALITLKVYCDFMAYSEIARGLAQLFGVKLTKNFRRPLLARNLSDFWQRWHVSLTRWIGTYIQLPLMKVFSGSVWQPYVTLVTMLIIGAWHGASWNFIVFGLYHGVALALWKPVSRLFNAHVSDSQWIAATVSRMMLAFILLTGGVIFYISDKEIMLHVLSSMLGLVDDAATNTAFTDRFTLARALFALAALSVYSFVAEYRKVELVEHLATGRSAIRWTIALILSSTILLLGNFESEAFVYFEF